MLLNYTRELKLLFHLNKWCFGVPYDWDEVSQSISPISSRKHDRCFTLASWILRTQILWTLISLLLSMLEENTAMSYFVDMTVPVIKSLMVRYRETQLPVDMLNRLNSLIVLVILVGIGHLILILNGYVLIKQRDLFHPLVSMTILCLVLFTYACLLLLLVAAGKVHTSSESCIKSWTSDTNILKIRLARKSLRALKPIVVE
jgi:hypothetical protein